MAGLRFWIAGMVLVGITAAAISMVPGAPAELSSTAKDDVKAVMQDYVRYSSLVQKLLTKNALDGEDVDEWTDTRRRANDRAKEIDETLQKVAADENVRKWDCLAEMLSGLRAYMRNIRGNWISYADPLIGSKSIRFSPFTQRKMQFTLATTDEIARQIKEFIENPSEYKMSCRLCVDKGVVKCTACTGVGACMASLVASAAEVECKGGGGLVDGLPVLCPVCSGTQRCGFCGGTGRVACPLFTRFPDLHPVKKD